MNHEYKTFKGGFISFCEHYETETGSGIGTHNLETFESLFRAGATAGIRALINRAADGQNVFEAAMELADEIEKANDLQVKRLQD